MKYVKLVAILVVIIFALVIISVSMSHITGQNHTPTPTYTAPKATYTAIPTTAPTPTPLAVQLVTKDASQIALNLEDIENIKIDEGITQHGWTMSTEENYVLPHEGAESICGVKFIKDEWLGYATYTKVIYNEVVVFPSVALAHEAYKKAEANLTADTTNPGIGDESWYYVGIGQSITFRKANVLVEVSLSFADDIEPYARICENMPTPSPTSVPTSTPTPTQLDSSATYQIKVSGTPGLNFKGLYSLMIKDLSVLKSVEGTVPTSYYVNGSSILVVLDSQDDSGVLTVQILKGNEILGESTTSKAHGEVMLRVDTY